MAKTGRQTPTQSFILKGKKAKGKEAIALYEQTGRTAIKWQENLCCDIMATDKAGLWVHQKFGYSVPRRNGKNEILTIRELWGLENGEQICHTAHRTTTSHAAWVRLCRLLTDAGYVELGRKKKGEKAPEKSFRSSKQYGLESVALTGGGTAVFRTRTPNGGLGEGFDLLVIDEAQEYTDAQESALIYTVSDSANPQTIFCGTPPTPISAGTVFLKMRNETLSGQAYDTGWAEWSIEAQTNDVNDTALWYQTNPSMGYHLDERKVRAEIRGDVVDFNIQRLGLWLQYNQHSVISLADWEALRERPIPALTGRLHVGVKFGHDGTHVAMSVAARTADDRVFVETIDCRSARSGVEWMVLFLDRAEWWRLYVDGDNGKGLLAEAMKSMRLKKPVAPTVKEVVMANAAFEMGVQAKKICHAGQPSLTASVTNCDKRAIGSGGGFGFRSIRDDVDVCILDSAILAYYSCLEDKGPQQRKIQY